MKRSSRPFREQGTQGSFSEGLSAEAQLDAADLPLEDMGEAPVEEDSCHLDLNDPSLLSTDDPGLLSTGDPAPATNDIAPEAAGGAYVEIVYKVEEGDNLWKIASRKLGSGVRYREIREWNAEVFEGQNTDSLQAGMVLKIRVAKSEENLKVPAPDADRPVEGRSAHGSEGSEQRPSRSTVKQISGRRRVAGR